MHEPCYTRTHAHTHTHIRFNTQSLHTKGLHTQTFIRKLFHIRTTYPYTHAHTHTHRHHLRTIFAPITNDVYFLFLRKQISAKSRVRFFQTNFCPMNFLTDVYVILLQHLTKMLSRLDIVSTCHCFHVQRSYISTPANALTLRHNPYNAAATQPATSKTTGYFPCNSPNPLSTTMLQITHVVYFSHDICQGFHKYGSVPRCYK